MNEVYGLSVMEVVMKKVAVIQDLSSFGKCSLTAAIPVLSVMGVQACPLPTAILSAQTGYPSYYIEDFTSKMNHFTEEWSKLNVSFDGIYTGFVTGEEQINNIFHFLDQFYTKETVLLVDPVMGDTGELYKMFTDELLALMRELVKQANVITPNITECCLLTGLSYEKLHSYHNEKDFLQAVEEAGNTVAAKIWCCCHYHWHQSASQQMQTCSLSEICIWTEVKRFIMPCNIMEKAILVQEIYLHP